MKFADVKNDVAFRKIFGNENRTETLISFLNSILGFEGDDRIVSVTILNPYQMPKLRGGKVSILDVRATDQRQQQFIVEMQVAEQEGFGKRVLYYLTTSYNSQIDSSDQYRNLKPAYFVGILSNFSHTANPSYISRSRIQDIDTGEVTIKDVEFNFIELQKFNKKLHELTTLTEKWVFFIKNAENLDVIPNNIDDEGLLSAYEQANKYAWTKEELIAYDVVSMREEEARAIVDAAIARGEARGRREEKAKAEAEKEQMILQMYKAGLSVQSIATITQKTEAEVQQIITKHQK